MRCFQITYMTILIVWWVPKFLNFFLFNIYGYLSYVSPIQLYAWSSTYLYYTLPYCLLGFIRLCSLSGLGQHGKLLRIRWLHCSYQSDVCNINEPNLELKVPSRCSNLHFPKYFPWYVNLHIKFVNL